MKKSSEYDQKNFSNVFRNLFEYVPFQHVLRTRSTAFLVHPMEVALPVSKDGMGTHANDHVRDAMVVVHVTAPRVMLGITVNYVRMTVQTVVGRDVVTKKVEYAQNLPAK